MIHRKQHLFAFVHISHYPQKRKYTGEEYSVHLKAVSELADSYGLTLGYEIGLCHDLLEDTHVTAYDLTEFLVRHYTNTETDFIVNSVIELTDVYTHDAYPNLNRKARKSLEVKRMANISENSQSIKYCDLIDNTKSIINNDPNFAKVYLKEKQELLNVMYKGNKELYKLAWGTIK